MDASLKDGSLCMEMDLEESMKKGIENSNCVVVCLSSDYLLSSQCRLELAHAIFHKKKIILCMVEPKEQGFFFVWKKEIRCEPLSDGSVTRSFEVLDDSLAAPDTSSDPFNISNEEKLCQFLRTLVIKKKYANFESAAIINWESEYITRNENKLLTEDKALRTLIELLNKSGIYPSSSLSDINESDEGDLNRRGEIRRGGGVAER